MQQGLLLATLLAVGAVSAHANLLLNPGFENGSGGRVSDWSWSGNVYQEPYNARSGIHSLKLFGNWSGPWNTSFVLQDLPVQAGQTLTLSGYAMHVTGDLLQGDNYALLKISWFDGPNGTGNILQPLPGPGTLFGEYAGVESPAITRDSAADTWHSLSVSAVAPDGTMSALALVLFVQPADHAGAAWFDDVSAVQECYAWGENIGWISFDQSVSDPPRIDLSTGKFAGYAYGENVGWLDLGSNGTHFVKTNTIDAGPDTDSDMIADAWELEQAEAAGLAPVLTHLGKSTDTDGDGKTDLAEYFADTDPFDFADYAQIVAMGRDEMTAEIFIEWTSSPRRLYEIGSTTALDGFTVDFDNLVPNQGATTTVMFADPVVERKFWQVGAKLPLAPPAA